MLNLIRLLKIVLLSLVWGLFSNAQGPLTQNYQFPSIYLFQNAEEFENVALKVHGKIPEWLNGSFIKTGPGLMKDKRGHTTHWFDGLAKLTAFDIYNGKVTYTTKFLRSDAYEKFQKTGEFDFAGFKQRPQANSFFFPDFLFNVKNKEITNANVNVAKINKRFIALTETPLPVQFDKTLNTIGPFEYADDLPKNYSFESAHVLKDPDTKDLWNFLIKIGIFKTEYQIYKIPNPSTKRTLVASIPVRSISYMHSFSLAGPYFVLIDYPIRAKKPRDIAKGFIQAFSWWQDEPTIIYVIDKSSGYYWSCKTEPFFSFHHVNAFKKEGRLFVDLVAYRTADAIKKINNPFAVLNTTNLWRLEINAGRGRVKINKPTDERLEFPRINEAFVGKEYRYFYAVNGKENGNGIIKYDYKTHETLYWFEIGKYANEPVFVARSPAVSEDDGVAISILNSANEKKSFLLILDAKNLKELARIEAPAVIPFGFHGKFFEREDLQIKRAS